MRAIGPGPPKYSASASEPSETSSLNTVKALKGHLKNGDDEKSGSQAYVPADPKDDKQLIAAVDLLHGVKRADAAPPKPDSSTAEPVPAPAPANSGGDALPTPAASPAPDPSK